MRIRGYRRPDGKFGIRNHVLILPCSVCAAETARLAAEGQKGVIYLPNQGGCSLSRKDLEVTLETLSGIAANPNIYGTVLLGNGCEVVQARLLAERIREKTNKPLFSFVIRQEGGSLKTAERVRAEAARLRREADQVPVETAGCEELVVGTECGGSDPTSGLAANPVVGSCADLLIAQGATVILSETPEMIGAEKILAARCASEEIKTRLLTMIREYEEDFIRVSENPRSGNPTPGNLEGGITTLEEKSLGCIHKAGSTPVNGVAGYGEALPARGLVVMDTPGQDIASMMGMAAAGAQLILFTTGHGTPTGSAVAPVIKITANPETARLMAEHTDFDCSSVLTGGEEIGRAGRRLLEQIEKTACGELTRAEKLGFGEVSLARYCNFA